MKTDMSFLPKAKQEELVSLVELITAETPIEMIILFGSYARGSWVEDKYDETRYRYQSDFDILVIVETRSESAQGKLERELEDIAEQAKGIHTPVSIIVHDIAFVNRRLNKAQYFFSDIVKEGILLYDSKRLQLNQPKELLPAERRRLAQEDFEYCFEKCKSLEEGVKFYFDKGKLNEAAFLLHQTTERLYTAILLVFTHYKPNTHDLLTLRKHVNAVDSRFDKVFPFQNEEDKRLFKLLRKSYVDARYKKHFFVNREDLILLTQEVIKLKELATQLCHERIASYI